MFIQSLLGVAMAVLLCQVTLATDKALNSDISITNASIRILPPGQQNTAAFITLHNHGDKPLYLHKLSSSFANKVEIHYTFLADGMSKMRESKNVSLKAGETLVFSPGQQHIMFIGLKKTLSEGENVDLKLCFGDFCQQVNLPAISVLNENINKNSHTHPHHSR